MNNTLSPLAILIIVTLVSSLIIFLERALPFFVFGNRKPPKYLSFIEKYIPPLIMICLTIYCLKDVSFLDNQKNISLESFLPHLCALFVTVILHLWKRNSLLSIFFGTAVFMILIRIL